jgi:sulfotransferase famil protein
MFLCFCHMIKTAGTTIQYILRNSFGAGHVEILDPLIRTEEIRRLLRINPRIVSLGGHFLRPDSGLEEMFPGIRYVTFLRDPVDRYLSHYNYGRRKNHHRMSIEERLRIVSESNYQTKYLLGARLPADRDFTAGEEHLEKAKRILREEYSFVGLVDRFDESLLLLQRTLDCKRLDIRYRRANVSQRIYLEKKDLSSDRIEEIRRVNRMDSLLFDYARDRIFKSRLESYGPSLESDLKDFRESLVGFHFHRPRLLINRLAKYLFYRPVLSGLISRKRNRSST